MCLRSYLANKRDDDEWAIYGAVHKVEKPLTYRPNVPTAEIPTIKVRYQQGLGIPPKKERGRAELTR